MFNKKEFEVELARNQISQKELAVRVGMSKNTMSSRVTGKKAFKADEIDKICNELKIVEDKRKCEIFLHTPSQNRDDIGA